MKLIQATLLGICTSALLTACVVAPAPTPYGGPIYREPVMVAPPPPVVEYQGYPPAPGYVWIAGFWNWGGHRHEWVPGRWVPPRDGQRWVPQRWERDGEHWRSRGGHWDDHHEHR